MTIAPHLVGQDLIDHLLGRDDLTVDDIAGLPEDLRFELLDGRLVLTPRALPIHQFISVRANNAIEEHCPDGIMVNVGQAVRLDRFNELCPDVMVFREEGADRSPIMSADVLLVIEVISPSSQSVDLGKKFERYRELGIPAYWIIDPLAERVTLTQFLLGPDGSYRQHLKTDELVTVEEPWKITLDLPAWTRRRDLIRERTRSR
ncbi:Uma2 family endonuclease [Actinoplanes subtropicus]|uniref:Uma2 family endonuclease n=1 Tax=Actinoplanes subtropicus TaxID=543632 RepID=UPI0004C36CF8|nr:Uma2 family endonuclease [Actinoplanes subtropicus]